MCGTNLLAISLNDQSKLALLLSLRFLLCFSRWLPLLKKALRMFQNVPPMTDTPVLTDFE